MNLLHADMSTLFEQLGLNNSEQEIESFLESHSSLAQGEFLYEAEYWNPSQATFLRQAIQFDAEWAGVVDLLDVMLRRAA